MSKKKPLLVDFEERQLDELRAIKKKTGVPVNHMIRSAVDAFLKIFKK